MYIQLVTQALQKSHTRQGGQLQTSIPPSTPTRAWPDPRRGASEHVAARRTSFYAAGGVVLGDEQVIEDGWSRLSRAGLGQQVEVAVAGAFTRCFLDHP